MTPAVEYIVLVLPEKLEVETASGKFLFFTNFGSGSPARRQVMLENCMLIILTSYNFLLYSRGISAIVVITLLLNHLFAFGMS